jgi:hypothetical protein
MPLEKRRLASDQIGFGKIAQIKTEFPFLFSGLIAV